MINPDLEQSMGDLRLSKQDLARITALVQMGHKVRVELTSNTPGFIRIAVIAEKRLQDPWVCPEPTCNREMPWWTLSCGVCETDRPE